LTKIVGRPFLLAAIAMTALDCGSSPSSPSGGGGNPTSATTITLTSAGVNPTTINVPQGSRVLFTNNDNRQHEMTSDPHPDHTDCPELNQVGFINPGQQRETGNLNTVRTCRYHDHNDPNNTRFQGRIVIQ
jgi:plastocyanin